MADDGEAAEHELYGGDVPEENDGEYDLEGAGGDASAGAGEGAGSGAAGPSGASGSAPAAGAGDDEGSEDPAAKVRPCPARVPQSRA